MRGYADYIKKLMFVKQIERVFLGDTATDLFDLNCIFSGHYVLTRRVIEVHGLNTKARGMLCSSFPFYFLHELDDHPLGRVELRGLGVEAER